MDNSKINVRVKRYDEYEINNEVMKGFAIELLNNDDEVPEWGLVTFIQMKDDKSIHSGFLLAIKDIEEMGYKIKWEI